MSLPARKFQPVHEPERLPSRRPVRTVPPSSHRNRVRSSRASGRRRVHVGFVIFASVVLTLMVAGVVAMNALLDQRTFQITALQRDVSSLQGRDRALVEQAAALDAPGRLGTWARSHGLVMPEQGAVVILDVPGQGPATGGRP